MLALIGGVTIVGVKARKKDEDKNKDKDEDKNKDKDVQKNDVKS
jgi:serine acetyltransferase